jgi:hypothetical protein
MTSDRLKKQDPRNQYPRPPFEKQPQPAPGLAEEMTPKPDHGEDSYEGHGRLKGRKALITGGDSGIGRAVAIAFAREGADVAIGYLPEEQRDAEDVIALIEKAGRKGIALPGDIKDESFCKSMVEKAVSEMGGLDILVNNAAAQTTSPDILELTTEQFDITMKTNLYALFWITKAAIPHLSPGSAIINTASRQAYKPSLGLVDYAITKAGIVDFTKSISKQMIKKGVRVNAVAPGPFWTPLQPSGGQTQDKLKDFGKDVPMGRPGQPVELAAVYVLLASQEASYITGEIYGVTGGEGIA